MNRRVDVELVGLTREQYSKGSLKTSGRHRKHEGRVGHLLFKQPQDVRDLKRKMVPVCGFETGGIKFPGACIRPNRRMEDGRVVDQAFHERVVIIGPDVNGESSSMGSYALVLPGNPLVHCADVLFTDGTRRQFHSSSLCLSRNRTVHLGSDVFPATTFPVS